MKKSIEELLKLNIKTKNNLLNAKRKIGKKYKIGILKNSDILKGYKDLVEEGKMEQNVELERLLRKRAVRTISGIAPVAVLTKQYKCPGNCAFCPTEKDVPQSYLSNEPAVMRAIRCGYHPYTQTALRLLALEANGHNPTKIELIVIGGTWSVFPTKYKYWYIKECFRAANDYGAKAKNKEEIIKKAQDDKNSITKVKLEEIKKQLAKEQKINEKAKYGIIGLTLETRPDYIDAQELEQMRIFGCTRVELGVQAIDDDILEKNKRGHGVDEVAKATKALRDFGFKITYHIMPGLPGSTAQKDFEMYQTLFNDERFQPDQIKFYPTVVTKGSLLYRWWKQGKYKPYSDKVLRDLILKCKNITPTYVRIIRLIRDIPGESIIAGNMITNLRQVMKDQGAKCKCIRCREPKNNPIKDIEIKIKKYKASNGWEYFISYESGDETTLYGFCRLRLPEENFKNKKFNVLNNSAIIRELHVYGELTKKGATGKVQHKGLGTKLVREAEKQAKQNGFKKMSIISGVGVRGFYRKLGYRVKQGYMAKSI